MKFRKPSAANATASSPSRSALSPQEFKMIESMLSGLGTAEAAAARPARSEAVHLLLGLFEQAVFFHTPAQEPFVLFAQENRRRLLPLRGNAFVRLLAHLYFAHTGGSASALALRETVDLFCARALEEGQVQIVFNRFGQGSGALWLDLCDHAGRAVRITSNGWEIVARPAAHFVRYTHQLPLPEPQAGGSLEALRPFFPLEHPADWLLVRAWMLAAMNPLVPTPMLCLIGPPGSGKTTAARLLRSLLDPSLVDTITLLAEERLSLALEHHALPVFDNIGRLRPSHSNLFCRAVTGASMTVPRLQGGEDLLCYFRRPMILTSLELPAFAPDWLERALILRLRALAPARRHLELVLKSEINQRLPQWLGALLTLQASTMAAYGRQQLAELPRMADFADWGAAAAIAADGQQEPYLEALAANTGRLSEELITTDPLPAAIHAFMRERTEEWRGTAQQLLAALQPLDASGTLKKMNAHAIGRRARNIQNLLARQISIEFMRNGDGTRQIKLRSINPKN